MDPNQHQSHHHNDDSEDQSFLSQPGLGLAVLKNLGYLIIYLAGIYLMVKFFH